MAPGRNPARALCSLAGGDPYGTAEPLWSRYFETTPGLREMYGTRDVPLGGPGAVRGGPGDVPEAGRAEPVLEASGGGRRARET